MRKFAVLYRKPAVTFYFFDKFFFRKTRTEFFFVNLIGIVVPNMHVFINQVFDIALAGEKPVELVQDTAPVNLLCREHREPLREVEANLCTKTAVGLYSRS